MLNGTAIEELKAASSGSRYELCGRQGPMDDPKKTYQMNEASFLRELEALLEGHAEKWVAYRFGERLPGFYESHDEAWNASCEAGIDESHRFVRRVLPHYETHLL